MEQAATDGQAVQTLQVELPGHAYPILIGRGLLARADSLLASYLARSQIALVSNTAVAPLYADALARRLREAGSQVLQINLPDGEAFKTRESFNQIHDALLEARFERRCTVMAVGGGVVGDIAGYAAATFLRGVSFIQVPTTLLAQVDSSVGGKTGINHPLGKNLIGAFHQPCAVLIDLDTLATLSEREFRAGVAEVLKYGFIRDAGFLGWLEANIEALMQREPAALAYAVAQSCRNKAQVVAADEHEQGERAILNFGHTFGHAIEAGLGFGTWLHGEAVAAGMVLAATASWQAGLLSSAERDRVRELIHQAGLPVQAPDFGLTRWMSLMAGDKKVDAGEIRFVLLEALGKAVHRRTLSPEVLQACLSSTSAVIAGS